MLKYPAGIIASIACGRLTSVSTSGRASTEGGRGLWQVELATAEDLFFERQGDLYLGAALCRLKYFDAPEPLPAGGDLAGMAAYWKLHYNTVKGAGKPAEFTASWRACGLERLYGG